MPDMTYMCGTTITHDILGVHDMMGHDDPLQEVESLAPRVMAEMQIHRTQGL